MKFYETVFTYSVLSTEAPYPEVHDLRALAYDVEEGDCSGHIVSTTRKELTLSELKDRCGEHGTDPDFFLHEAEY